MKQPFRIVAYFLIFWGAWSLFSDLYELWPAADTIGSKQNEKSAIINKDSETNPPLQSLDEKEAQLLDSPPVPVKKPEPLFSKQELSAFCENYLGGLKGKHDSQHLEEVCQKAQRLRTCQSHEGSPIFHYDRPSKKDHQGQRILTFALIHGDEAASGSVARSWMTRLDRISPRNSWRIVPILNPDGLNRGTRMNARGVDLNRNFPSKDWSRLAHKYWHEKKGADPRRFPGKSPASEVETRCAMNHIADFNPDLVISIHTPLGVLDFDGPRMNFPKFQGLPWTSLGTFPGSLGRYLWVDHGQPVLTVELLHDLPTQLEKFDSLQDVSGLVAIRLANAASKDDVSVRR